LHRPHHGRETVSAPGDGDGDLVTVLRHRWWQDRYELHPSIGRGWSLLDRPGQRERGTAGEPCVTLGQERLRIVLLGQLHQSGEQLVLVFASLLGIGEPR